MNRSLTKDEVSGGEPLIHNKRGSVHGELDHHSYTNCKLTFIALLPLYKEFTISSQKLISNNVTSLKIFTNSSKRCSETPVPAIVSSKTFLPSS